MSYAVAVIRALRVNNKTTKINLHQFLSEILINQTITLARLNSTVSSTDSRSRGHKFQSHLSHLTFVKTDHEIISNVILPLPLIQKGAVVSY